MKPKVQKSSVGSPEEQNCTLVTKSSILWLPHELKMGWKESEVRLLLLFCLFEKGLSGRVPGGEVHRRTRGEAQMDPIPNLTSPNPISSSPNPNPSGSQTSHTNSLLSRPNAIPPLGSHKEESGDAVTIGVQVVKVPSLKFHEKVRSF